MAPIPENVWNSIRTTAVRVNTTVRSPGQSVGLQFDSSGTVVYANGSHCIILTCGHAVLHKNSPINALYSYTVNFIDSSDVNAVSDVEYRATLISDTTAADREVGILSCQFIFSYPILPSYRVTATCTDMRICMSANTYGSYFFRNMRGRLSSPNVPCFDASLTNVSHLIEYFIPAGEGASGGGVYDSEGRMFAMHISTCSSQCDINMPPTWPDDWKQQLSIRSPGLVFQGLPLTVVQEELSRLCLSFGEVISSDKGIYRLCDVLSHLFYGTPRLVTPSP